MPGTTERQYLIPRNSSTTSTFEHLSREHHQEGLSEEGHILAQEVLKTFYDTKDSTLTKDQTAEEPTNLDYDDRHFSDNILPPSKDKQGLSNKLKNSMKKIKK